ncbi:MAG TPA: peptidyl-prolyl cis-trans isomerase [Anaerohalosphaeraceae bacterium]|mgnify:CR=1 FL=1|nr:peptidyl-prolyl cis-trans isomerase [Anaerohalosphaeraceae bacterium]
MTEIGRFLGCLLAAGLFFYSGCGSKPKGKFTPEQMRQIPLANKTNLPQATGGMVLGVYSETVSSEEVLLAVEEYLKPAAAALDEQAFEEKSLPIVRKAIRGKITDILIYREARQKAPENIDDNLDKAVEAETTRFVAGYGNNYALAESKLNEMGMDWRSFRDYQKKMIMIQSYLSSTLKEEKRFSQQQLKEYYEQIKNAQYCRQGRVGFSIIEIRPELLTSQQCAGQTPAQAAQRIGADLVRQLQEGADFAQLAKQYHGDLAAVGGRMMPVVIGSESLTEPYQSLEKQALQMQPGQIAGPLPLEGRLFILKLDMLETSGCRPFEEVQNEVAQQLQFERRRQQYEAFVNGLIEKANIAQLDRFGAFCVQEAYRRWGQNRSS